MGPITIMFVIAMFLSGLVAAACYFSIEAKLESIGEPTTRFYSAQSIIKILTKYRELAAKNSWPIWLPHGYWTGLAIALLFGLLLIYRR
jgi:hypothetical protein